MKVGDTVIVDEVFTKEDCGRMLKVKPFLSTILRIQKTPSMGYLYLLADKDGNHSNVWYYDYQVKKVQEDSETLLWRAWGDR